jgi:hypothetical protein
MRRGLELVWRLEEQAEVPSVFVHGQLIGFDLVVEAMLCLTEHRFEDWEDADFFRRLKA